MELFSYSVNCLKSLMWLNIRVVSSEAFGRVPNHMFCENSRIRTVSRSNGIEIEMS